MSSSPRPEKTRGSRRRDGKQMRGSGGWVAVGGAAVVGSATPGGIPERSEAVSAVGVTGAVVRGAVVGNDDGCCVDATVVAMGCPGSCLLRSSRLVWLEDLSRSGMTWAQQRRQGFWFRNLHQTVGVFWVKRETRQRRRWVRCIAIYSISQLPRSPGAR